MGDWNAEEGLGGLWKVEMAKKSDGLDLKTEMNEDLSLGNTTEERW